MSADLARFYGLHSDDIGTPRLRWGYLRDLLAHLPEGSAWAEAQYGARPWGPTEFLLRGIFMALGGSEVDSPQEARHKLRAEQVLDERLLALRARDEARRRKEADE